MVSTKKPTRIFMYEPRVDQRFIPKLCPTCPHFKGESTCMIHVSTVEKDSEDVRTFSLTYLDKDNPYLRKDECEFASRHRKPQVHNKVTNLPCMPNILETPFGKKQLEVIDQLAQKYSKKEKSKPELFISNFKSVCESLLIGGELLLPLFSNRWQLCSNYREAFKEFLNTSEEETPSPFIKRYSDEEFKVFFLTNREKLLNR